MSNTVSQVSPGAQREQDLHGEALELVQLVS